MRLYTTGRRDRTQDRLVDHVLAVRHANHQNVVERVDAVYFGQELIYYRVRNTGAVADRPSTLTDRVLRENQRESLPQLRGQRRVDGVGRLTFDFHTGRDL